MRLQTKATLTVVGVFICLIAVVSIAGSWVLMRDYARLEDAYAREQAARVQRFLGLEVEGIERSARDYAEWDDTVAFLQNHTPDYVQENWSAPTLANLNVHMVLAYRADGAFHGGARSVDEETIAPAPEWVEAFEKTALTVTADRSSASRVHGLIRSGNELAMFACVPVLRTGGDGEPQGALVHVRWFDQRLVARVAEIAGHPVEASTIPITSSRADGRPDLSITQAATNLLIVQEPLVAFDGHTIGTLTLRLPRPIASAGAQARRLLMAEVVVTGVLFGLLVALLIRWLVTARLERLSANLRDVAQRQDEKSRLPVEGDDEIALVARETNAMLDALARHQSEREHAHREREALQQQLLQAQKMEAIGEFAGGIAHDFNNCLTSITSWVQLVHDDLPAGHTGREGLADALNSARHAALVVRQLLAYSQPGRFTPAPVHVGELVTESLGLLRSALRRTIELRVHAAGGDDLVMADRTQLMQVLMNLLNNSKDAMGDKGTLTITIGEVDLPDTSHPGTEHLPAGRYVRILVQDTGPGILPQHMGKLFKPFFTTKPQGKGTGLGLAVVHNVVTRHGGAISVTSMPGEGATFHVFLPHHVPEAAKAEPPVLLPSGCRVLMAEDDLSVQTVLARVLERHQCTVVRARDGEEAWELIEKGTEPFDVVLTDLSMPRLTGMQLMERITNSGVKVPVVLMTAYAATLNPRQVRDAGFAAVLSKPMVMEEVVSTLSRVARRTLTATPGG